MLSRHTCSVSVGGIVIADYLRDGAGNTIRIERENGITTTKTYDEMNRITSVHNIGPNEAPISSHAYTLGRAGERLNLIELGGRNVTWTHDARYQILREEITDPNIGNKISTWSYDAVGNRTAWRYGPNLRDYTYDENDRIVADGTRLMTHDANGNRLSITDESGVTTFTWSPENNLSSVRTPLGQVDFTYDSDGLRVQRNESGNVSRYIIDTNRPFAQVLEERDAANIPSAAYVYGDELLWQTRSSERTFYHGDALGSTRVLTDADGSIIDQYDFDAFGEVARRTGSTPNTFLFAGEQFEPAISGYYLRARYYEPTSGRFLSMDPAPGDIRRPHSLHRYTYAESDPVDKSDPSGLTTMIDVQVANGTQQNLQKVSKNAASETAKRKFLTKDWQVYIAAEKTRLTVGRLRVPFVHAFMFVEKLQSGWGFPYDISAQFGQPIPAAMGAFHGIMTVDRAASRSIRYKLPLVQFSHAQHLFWAMTVRGTGFVADQVLDPPRPWNWIMPHSMESAGALLTPLASRTASTGR